MSSIKLDEIIHKFPADKKPIKRLESLLNVDAPREYTFEHLYRKVSPSTVESFALVLSELVKRGMLEKIIRVESPRGGGIGDYHSIAEVPDEIKDWRTDQILRVRPEQLRVIFRVNHS